MKLKRLPRCGTLALGGGDINDTDTNTNGPLTRAFHFQKLDQHCKHT